MTRPAFDFDYAPLHFYDERPVVENDFIVAAERRAGEASLSGELPTSIAKTLGSDPRVSLLLDVTPLLWFRVQIANGTTKAEVFRLLTRAGLPVRYVASARFGTQELGVPLDFRNAPTVSDSGWRVRAARAHEESATPGRWFLGESGVDVDRALCGTGAGTRMAVIDNDGRDLERVGVDAEIRIEVETIPRGSSHAAISIGWAAGLFGDVEFMGVAPDASPRFYCIPKPGNEVFALPLAIVRAVADGADVVVCSTHADGQTSPMLDDALEFAYRLGRGGRGAAVIFPSSREMSSPLRSVHSSLSLGVGEPAADPRVFCIGPSSRNGDWFLWRDRRGKLRPFANRGPSLRWLSPGDDMAYPFAVPERLAHAESSGAAAVACGVLLLVIGANPQLTRPEVDAVLTASAVRIDPLPQSLLKDLADRADLQPVGVDLDGHNAKHGYGRLSASRACALATDPKTLAHLVADDARLPPDVERALSVLKPCLSDASGRHLARLACSDASFLHSLKAILRSIRLWSGRPERALEQPTGALLRQLLVTLRCFVLDSESRPSSEVQLELTELERTIRAASKEPLQARSLEQSLLAHCRVLVAEGAATAGGPAGEAEAPAPAASALSAG